MWQNQNAHTMNIGCVAYAPHQQCLLTHISVQPPHSLLSQSCNLLQNKACNLQSVTCLHACMFDTQQLFNHHQFCYNVMCAFEESGPSIENLIMEITWTAKTERREKCAPLLIRRLRNPSGRVRKITFTTDAQTWVIFSIGSKMDEPMLLDLLDLLVSFGGNLSLKSFFLPESVPVERNWVSKQHLTTLPPKLDECVLN